MSFPQIAVRAKEPSDALMAAYLAPDPTEFFRLAAEMYPEDRETEFDADMAELKRLTRS